MNPQPVLKENMNLQPILRGKRVQLRPLETRDFEALYAVAKDPLIWELHPQPDRFKRDVFEVLFKSGIDSGGALIIEDCETGETVGSSRYYDYEPGSKTLQTGHHQAVTGQSDATSPLSSVIIGYTFYARKYWGGSYNREIKTLMMEYAFKSVDTAIFHVWEKNFRSQRAMEKIGGIKTGTLSKELYGKDVVSFIYEITREEFKSGPLRVTNGIL